MISVIIPYSEDQTYLVRCLNAIKRQTYKDTEIILITNEVDDSTVQKYDLNLVKAGEISYFPGINEAISQAKGEHILFCSMTSLIPNDLLEKLMLHEESEEDFKWAFPIFVEKGNEFVQDRTRTYSIYGKLFNKKNMKQKVFCEGFAFCELSFLANVMQGISEIKFVEEECIYETGSYNNLLADEEYVVDIDAWKEMLLGIKSLKKELQREFLQSLYKDIKQYKDKFSELLLGTEAIWHDNHKLIYELSLITLNNWWNEIRFDEEFTYYDDFKTFLSLYENDEDFLEILLGICGLLPEQYKYIKKYDAEEACFYIEANINGASIPNVLLQKNMLKLMAFSKIVERKLGINMLEEMGPDLQILNGIKNGLIKIGEVWFYYENGSINEKYVGLAKNQFGWFMVKNGTIDLTYSGLATNEYGIWAVENGKIDSRVNGVRKCGDEIAAFVNGKVDSSVSGLEKVEGKWYYFKDGFVDVEFVGMVPNPYGVWYVEKGTINFEFEGLVQSDGKWLFVRKGTIDRTFKGFAKNQYGWWYVEEGTIDLNDISQREEIERAAAEYKKLNGAELANFSVDKYANGELGLKTISQSFSSWMKFKFSGKNN